jgi:predicted GNAT family acetyltransferase
VGVFNVATPPEHRRKGYGARITAKAVASGFRHGAESAFLQASEMGFGVYEALGFRTVTTYVVRTRPHD